MSYKPQRHISLVVGLLLAAVAAVLLSQTELAYAEEAPQNGPPLHSLIIEEADGQIWEPLWEQPYVDDNVSLRPDAQIQVCSNSGLLRITYYMSAGLSSIWIDGNEVGPEQAHPGAKRIETVGLPASQDRVLVIRTSSDTNPAEYSDHTVNICSNAEAPKLTSLRLTASRGYGDSTEILNWSNAGTGNPSTFQLCYPYTSSHISLSYGLDHAGTVSIRGPTRQELVPDASAGIFAFQLDQASTNYQIILLANIGGLSNRYTINICTNPVTDIEIVGVSDDHEDTSVVSMDLPLTPSYDPSDYFYRADNLTSAGAVNEALSNVMAEVLYGSPPVTATLLWEDGDANSVAVHDGRSYPRRFAWGPLPWTLEGTPSRLTVEVIHPVLIDGSTIGQTPPVTYTLSLKKYEVEDVIVNPEIIDVQNTKCPDAGPEVSWSNLGEWDHRHNEIDDGRAVPYDTSRIDECEAWGNQETIALGRDSWTLDWVDDHQHLPQLFKSDGWKFFVGDDNTAYRAVGRGVVLGIADNPDSFQYITDRGFLLTTYQAGGEAVEGLIADHTGRPITWFTVETFKQWSA